MKHSGKMGVNNLAIHPRAGAEAAKKCCSTSTPRAPTENYTIRKVPVDGRMQIRGKSKGKGGHGYVA